MPEPGESKKMATPKQGGHHAVIAVVSARFAVSLVGAAPGAELLELEPVRIIAPILLRDVVALLALGARECDLRTYVLSLLGHDLIPRVWRLVATLDEAW